MTQIANHYRDAHINNQLWTYGILSENRSKSVAHASTIWPRGWLALVLRCSLPLSVSSGDLPSTKPHMPKYLVASYKRHESRRRRHSLEVCTKSSTRDNACTSRMMTQCILLENNKLFGHDDGIRLKTNRVWGSTAHHMLHSAWLNASSHYSLG